jgi:hypothetical protein
VVKKEGQREAVDRPLMRSRSEHKSSCFVIESHRVTAGTFAWELMAETSLGVRLPAHDRW